MHSPDRVFRAIVAIQERIPFAEGVTYHLGIKQFYQDMLYWDGTQRYLGQKITYPDLVDEVRQCWCAAARHRSTDP